MINENIVYGFKDSFEFKFKFKNTSQSEVKIEKIESICDCTKVASDKFIYMPNEFGVISGMLDIKNKYGEFDMPNEFGVISGMLDIKNKYGEFERRIILHTNDIMSRLFICRNDGVQSKKKDHTCNRKLFYYANNIHGNLII